MVSTQFLLRPLPRYSQGFFLVVTLIQDLVLQVDADGKSVLFPRATIKRSSEAFCDKFCYQILSLLVRDYFGVSHDRLYA